MLKVLIADAWPIFRSGIKHIRSEELGTLEVTEIVPVLRAVKSVSGPWDLAVVSVDVPTREGLHFVIALRGAYPRQRVLALARRANISYVESALKSSIRGLVAKESAPEDLVKAATIVIAGKKTGGFEDP